MSMGLLVLGVVAALRPGAGKSHFWAGVALIALGLMRMAATGL